MIRAAFCLILTLGAAGCFQTENSSSLDADTYGNLSGTAEFLAARTIFSQNCGGTCHNYHAQSEAQLKAAGLFIVGLPDSSKLFYRLVGSSGAQGPKNMPSGGALSSSDLQKIRYWIVNATP
jgi:hypothetical protein